jgi:hypothetical protein
MRKRRLSAREGKLVAIARDNQNPYSNIRGLFRVGQTEIIRALKESERGK